MGMKQKPQTSLIVDLAIATSESITKHVTKRNIC